jgi:hypothetical protein
MLRFAMVEEGQVGNGVSGQGEESSMEANAFSRRPGGKVVTAEIFDCRFERGNVDSLAWPFGRELTLNSLALALAFHVLEAEIANQEGKGKEELDFRVHTTPL